MARQANSTEPRVVPSLEPDWGESPSQTMTPLAKNQVIVRSGHKHRWQSSVWLKVHLATVAVDDMLRLSY